MSPRVDPAAFPDPTQNVALVLAAQQARLDRIRALCREAEASAHPAGMLGVYIRDVLAVLDDPDPLGR
jgi:hypothetical protein